MISLNEFAPHTDDFFFLSLWNTKNDTIVICNPAQATCLSPVFLRSRKTLDEHIQCVQQHQLKKALVVAEDISFLRQCPSLEYIRIIPSLSAKSFDYSPLYELPNLKSVTCDTMFGEHEQFTTNVDYRYLPDIQELFAWGKRGHHNISSLKKLKKLTLSDGQPTHGTLKDCLNSPSLEELVLLFSSVSSLSGLDAAPNLRTLELSQCRKLTDLSELRSVKDSLISLIITKCNKINDFSVLSSLHNLRSLTLEGANVLNDLSFLRGMPDLQHFTLKMNVSNGDLSLCDSIPYVRIQNRKHFSRKDSDLSKKRKEGLPYRVVLEHKLG